ncbi:MULTISPECIES: sensor histidine kinase [Streptomyces]|uniref:sensor histidine kinase n=1 Tax=Streptomyces TaxID=1883 RepID=UPI000F54F6D6|nr:MULTISPECIES: histidine kinase [Streptomyces]RPK45048.1 Sensor histidine kinase DesK [Streptomyces sp. ADI91-18]WBY22369.1 histidine kinase [Streptomyces goshikiensis]WSS01141.1 histidine kinase [Streptomyces goshikiensis]
MRAWGERIRRADPRWRDLGLTLLVQVATTIPFVVPRDPLDSPATWPAYALTTLGNVPLMWRRRPVAAIFGMVVADSVYTLALDGPGQPLPYAPLVGVYTMALLCPPRVRIAMGVAVSGLVVASVALNTGTARELLFALFVFAAAYALGRLQHTRQAYTAAVEARAAELERANRIEAEQAAARERARIAREMHDVLSHAVSIMIVQAEAGPVAVRRAPERAEAAFDAIAETGRDAMAQLRTMLGVLRADGAARAAPRGPQPGVEELAGLLERVRGSGLEVSYERTGAVRGLPAALEATVHRVVQEALTNVVKHAGASRVSVRLEYGARELAVTVTDDGRGPGSGGRGSGAAPGGHGLIGIRERAAAHGGTAVAGPGPGGSGFEVRVVLVTSPLEVGS